MASKLFNLHIMKLSSILIPPQFNFVPNTTSSANFTSPCVSYTLMGFTTFVPIHPNHSIALGFMNECVALESNK